MVSVVEVVLGNLKQAKFVDSETSRPTPLPSYFFKLNNFVDC